MVRTPGGNGPKLGSQIGPFRIKCRPWSFFKCPFWGFILGMILELFFAISGPRLGPFWLHFLSSGFFFLAFSGSELGPRTGSAPGPPKAQCVN